MFDDSFDKSVKTTVTKFSRISLIAITGIFLYAGLKVSAHHHKNIDQNKQHKDCQICIIALNNVMDNSKPPVVILKSPGLEQILYELSFSSFDHIIYTNNQPQAPPLEIM